MRKKQQLIIFSLAALIIGVIVFSSIRSPAGAASSDTVYDRAWSENIGWISFNCTNFNSCERVDYGVTVAPNGRVSGRAWSEHIGWISFDQTSGCPTAPCQAQRNPENGELTGWARACAGTLKGNCSGPDADGWDGWIHLRGPGYGVAANGCRWLGHAWGSTVIGWISFHGLIYGVKELTGSCLPPAAPTPPAPTQPPRAQCIANNQCPRGLTCQNGVCAAPPPPTPTAPPGQRKAAPPSWFREIEPRYEVP